MNVATPNVKIETANGEVVTSIFQLLQWKHALKLEAKGMTMSRGRKVSTHLRKLFGLKRSVKIEQIQEIVEDLQAQIDQKIEAA